MENRLLLLVQKKFETRISRTDKFRKHIMAISSGENTVPKEQYIRGWNVPPPPPDLDFGFGAASLHLYGTTPLPAAGGGQAVGRWWGSGGGIRFWWANTVDDSLHVSYPLRAADRIRRLPGYVHAIASNCR